MLLFINIFCLNKKSSWSYFYIFKFNFYTLKLFKTWNSQKHGFQGLKPQKSDFCMNANLQKKKEKLETWYGTCYTCTVSRQATFGWTKSDPVQPEAKRKRRKPLAGNFGHYFATDGGSCQCWNIQNPLVFIHEFIEIF